MKTTKEPKMSSNKRSSDAPAPKHYKMSVKVGDQFLLWRCDMEDDAYTDQMGVHHQSQVLKEAVVVTVKKVKKVPCSYSKDTYEGWLAKDAQGREFTCNWQSFPDDSSSPTYYWACMEAGKDFLFSDATQMCSRGWPVVTKDREKAVPTAPVLSCAKHKFYWLPHQEYGCFDCCRENHGKDK